MTSTGFSDLSCAWLVQRTIRGETYTRLRNACAENGNPFFSLDVVPFSPEMPDNLPDIDGPFVFYGYATLLLAAFAAPRWRRGVFFDPAVFRPSVYRQRWGARMLSDDARVLTARQFAETDLAPRGHAGL